MDKAGMKSFAGSRPSPLQPSSSPHLGIIPHLLCKFVSADPGGKAALPFSAIQTQGKGPAKKLGPDFTPITQLHQKGCDWLPSEVKANSASPSRMLARQPYHVQLTDDASFVLHRLVASGNGWNTGYSCLGQVVWVPLLTPLYLVDLKTPTKAPTLQKISTEAPVLQKTPTKAPVPLKTPTESPTPIKTPAKLSTPTEALLETPALTETYTESSALTKALLETPVPTETSALTKTYAETSTLTEALLETPALIKTYAESTTLTETYAESLALTKTYMESLALIEALPTILVLVKALIPTETTREIKFGREKEIKQGIKASWKDSYEAG
ncbi:hypothetical protein CIB48_g170 [Xylaria polymorpha]|nr:hypothetical protein CIB48_g170 [Xylaria polymorpha]